MRNLKLPIARSTIHPLLSKINIHYWKTSKIEKKNHWSIIGEFFNNKKYFLIWKLNFFTILLMNFDAFLNFYFILLYFGWMVNLAISIFELQNFWYFDSPRCASAVIWNRYEPFLLQCTIFLEQQQESSKYQSEKSLLRDLSPKTKA